MTKREESVQDKTLHKDATTKDDGRYLIFYSWKTGRKKEGTETKERNTGQ